MQCNAMQNGTVWIPMDSHACAFLRPCYVTNSILHQKASTCAIMNKLKLKKGNMDQDLSFSKKLTGSSACQASPDDLGRGTIAEVCDLQGQARWC